MCACPCSLSGLRGSIKVSRSGASSARVALRPGPIDGGGRVRDNGRHARADCLRPGHPESGLQRSLRRFSSVECPRSAIPGLGAQRARHFFRAQRRFVRLSPRSTPSDRLLRIAPSACDTLERERRPACAFRRAGHDGRSGARARRCSVSRVRQRSCRVGTGTAARGHSLRAAGRHGDADRVAKVAASAFRQALPGSCRRAVESPAPGPSPGRRTCMVAAASFAHGAQHGHVAGTAGRAWQRARSDLHL
jgi:hypothetical protein